MARHLGQGLKRGMLGTVALLVLGSAAGCGTDFDQGDCRSRHDCPVPGSGAGASGAPNEPGSGVDAAGAGGDADAGAGGAAFVPPVGCHSAEECDDGDANNGVESCSVEGECVAGDPPPYVTAVSPEQDATKVDRAAKVVLTFSEPLDAATITSESIKLLSGDSVIAGKVSYADSKVTFTPDSPFDLLAEYEISVSMLVTDAAGEALLAPYTSSFVTRDGAWSSVTAVAGDIYQVAQTLPMTAKGDALVSWIAITDGSNYCPTSARWFNSGKSPFGDALTSSKVQDCRFVAAGANATGVAAVAWQEDHEYASQYRAGAWSAMKTEVSSFGSSWMFAVGVAPNDVVSVLEQDLVSGTYAGRSNASGAWGAAASNIAAGARGLSPAQIAFDSESNGFAVWRAETSDGNDEILWSRYTSASGWASAKVMPKSLAASSAAGNERGVPAIAVTPSGDAMAAWVQLAGAEKILVASRFSGNSWSSPVRVSGEETVTNLVDAPGLAFDGNDFVVAWVGNEGGDGNYAFFSRYDAEAGSFAAGETRSRVKAQPRMPQLGADAHRNLLMTWIVPGNEGNLFYARYDAHAGSWNDSERVPESHITDTSIATNHTVPFGVAANGMAAVMWGHNYASAKFTEIRLASFF